jgi:SHS2 domain-containing protein
MKNYEFIEEAAIADIAFHAYGKDYAELFKNACKAVTDAMVDIEKIEEHTEEDITMQANSMESLLYNILEELVYLKDAKQLVFRSFNVTEIEAKPPDCRINMTMKGEIIDRKKHNAHADVKAVTMKDFGIEETKDGLKASVILDI